MPVLPSPFSCLASDSRLLDRPTPLACRLIFLFPLDRQKVKLLQKSPHCVKA